MAFNSYIFVLAFLPVCLAGYFVLNHFNLFKISKLFLIAMSLLFYAWSNPKYLFVLFISITINYIAFIFMEKANSKSRIILWIDVIFNIVLLMYFKYTNFFAANMNRFFSTDISIKNIILPLGISFITFQQLAFVIDAYKKEIIECSFQDYVFYISFFPHILSGPIVSPEDFLPQINDFSRKRINWNNLSRGIVLFALGLGKKVLIADTFGAVSDWGFSNVQQLNTTNAILAMLSFTIQIYCDFSGYCDMAIGVSEMLNFDLPDNFNSPYKALTISDFWKRWHITLTRFLTKYIYIPLGGNRSGKFRTYIHILIVFIISGFWHGAGWTFIIWGILHGLFSVINRHFKQFFEKLHPALSWLITFGFLNISWIFFRANSVHDALVFLKRIALFDFGSINTNISKAFVLPEFSLPLKLVGKILSFDFLGGYPQLLLIAFFALSLVMILGCSNAVTISKKFKPTVVTLLATAFLMLWCVISMGSVGTFLYFNF